MNTESNSGWKVLLTLAVVAVLAGGFFYMRSGVVSPTTSLTEKSGTVSEPALSMNDVEGMLLKNSAEEAALVDESGDASLLSSDSAALDNMSKSYDEQTL